jgi:homoserine acetyltransferase
MIEAQYRLLTEGLKVNHLRLVMGTSMGGMHTWLWGEIHPDFMDALMPLASLPTQISGRNRVWRRVIIDSIRGAPDWQEGNYQAQPYGLRLAAEMLYFMGENPALRYKEAPTLQKADTVLDAYVTRLSREFRRERRPVRGRGFARLRSRPRFGKDQSAAAGDQFRGRSHQSARPGNSRA